jgi:hypothetical protein
MRVALGAVKNAIAAYNSVLSKMAQKNSKLRWNVGVTAIQSVSCTDFNNLALFGRIDRFRTGT